MDTREKANILLVDDQVNNLIALEAMLADLGENLVRAESGTETLRRLLEQDFAVILLDVQMPGLDGFETARLIRERERSRQIPIIFVTALSRNESNMFRGYSIGAVDYLFKPIVPEVLRSKVSFFVELHRKTRELKQQAAELARVSQQNELILNSASDGVLGIDLEGRTTFANPAALRLLGLTKDRVIGRDGHDLLHAGRDLRDLCNDGKCCLSDSLRGGCEMQETTFRRSDGISIPVDFSIAAMRNEDGETLGSVLTFRDITERRAAAMAMENERLYREAQAANQAKDDFLATISHELRTPMTAILGWLEMLSLDEEMDPELLNEGVQTIRRSAKLQAQLIDDLLDVSRIITGKFLFELKPIALSNAIESAVETLRPSAAQKQIELRVNESEARPTVLGDATRLKQVFWNLLSNAVKFSEPGTAVDIDVTTADEETIVTVRDHGAGIDPDLLPHVFERLRQGRDARRHGGLGLGLAIVRHIIDCHGGSIEAESEGLGKGATFRVTLPLANRQTMPDGSREIRASRM